MTTFVLTHGAWGGSYGFREVRRLLHAAGHEAISPSLTGIGERAHLSGPQVSLSTHVLDLANAIRYEDVDDIVLLGFSYGGMVVTGALDLIGDRVRHLVYLDAFVPANGQSAADLVPHFAATIAADYDTSTGNLGAGWALPPLPRELDTPEQTAWSNARRAHQPVRTLTEAVQLSTPLEQHPFPLTYIKATADPNEPADSPFWQAAHHAQASERWSYHAIDTNHMVPMTRPTELAEILSTL